MNMEKHFITRAFFFIVLAAILYSVYLVFKPFLVIILAATILATIFYTPYKKMVELFKGRRNLAALIMCILIAMIVIIPLSNFIVYTAQRSIEAYDTTTEFFNKFNIDHITKQSTLSKYNVLGLSEDTLRRSVIDLAEKMNEWLVNGAGNFIRGTTNFIFSLLMIIFTLFFFFVDGEKMVEKLMFWTPLPNKYDRELFKKFKDVSISTMVSTFITAIAQGLVGAIGFIIVGLPAFFAGIAMGFLSLLPYIGSAFVWFPAGIYLLFIGKIWQGIFLLAWGAGVVSTIDNLIRAYVIKGKAEVHPIFVIFSILGGIMLFGFWGVVFGPLIIALAVTVMHIYELEYHDILEK